MFSSALHFSECGAGWNLNPEVHNRKAARRMAKIELYVTLEISDDAVALLDASAAGGATELAMMIVKNSLSHVSGFRKVTVDVAEVADGAEDDGDEIESAPDTRMANTVRSPASAAHTGKSGYPFPNRRSNAPDATQKGGPSGKTGRPATLHNLRASDGDVVRASGPRSREVLESQGVTVWDEEAGETAPKVTPKNIGQRVKAVKSSGPVVRRRS